MTNKDDQNAMKDPALRGDRPYQAFLVRCWREETGWRYSLEAVGRGRKQGFDSLDAFLAALQTDLAQLSDAADDLPDKNDTTSK